MNQVKCKVVMLPTEKASHIWKTNTKGTISYTITEEFIPHEKLGKAQHLYILSDEEIKEGDWFINFSNINDKNNNLVHCSSRGCELNALNNKSSWFKIIATTDANLQILGNFSTKPGNVGYHPNKLPRPSETFLKKYCESQGNIEEILVETETVLTDPDLTTEITRERIKVAPDNTITIHPFIEKVYSKLEVKELIKQAWGSAYKFAEDNLKANINTSSISLKDFIIKNDLL